MASDNQLNLICARWLAINFEVKYMYNDIFYYIMFYISVHFSSVVSTTWNINLLNEAVQIILSPSGLHSLEPLPIPNRRFWFYGGFL